MHSLRRLGWDWAENGATLFVDVDGKTFQVFVPLQSLVVEFGRGLQSVGCPLPQQVGDCGSVSGWFSSIKNAVRSVSRTVKKAVPKVITRTAQRIQRTASQAIRRYIPASVRKGLQTAALFNPITMSALTIKEIAEGKRLDQLSIKRAMQSPAARFVARYGGYLPLAGQAFKYLEGAQSTLDAIDKGIAAAEQFRRGVRNPQTFAAMAKGIAQKAAMDRIASAAGAGNPNARAWLSAAQNVAR
jgi:hypothetical protein